MHSTISPTLVAAVMVLSLASGASANEVTVQNDSLVNYSTGTIQAGFVVGEKAAAWLTSPCEGNIVAAQVFWRSFAGTSPQIVQDSVEIFRSGSFPVPGDLAQTIGGPVLTDGVINEYRYLDENNTIPLSVPVEQDEKFVLALTFAEAPDPTQGPSVVNDNDGIQPDRNAIYAYFGGSYVWFSNSDLGVAGDWVLRAVVNCQAGGSSDADVGVTMSADPAQYTAGAPLSYTVTVTNAGPGNALNTTLVDTFPAAYTGVTWTCLASGGSSCPAEGNGTIAHSISLPSASQVVYTTSGIIADETTGTISNSATAVVGPPANDPNGDNNTAILDIEPAGNDVVFRNGFDSGAGNATREPGLPLLKADVWGESPLAR